MVNHLTGSGSDFARSAKMRATEGVVSGTNATGRSPLSRKSHVSAAMPSPLLVWYSSKLSTLGTSSSE